MEKLSFEIWKNTMSFVIDDEFDNSFLLSIEPLTKFINENCHKFSNPESLSEFLTTNDKFPPIIKLKAFISLIGLSEERLKRVVSLVRYRFYNEVFKSEWDIKKISSTIKSDSIFKNNLIDFFIDGRNSIIGSEIPLYYMRNFKLTNQEFINDLKNHKYVERILNDNEIQGKYSNRIGTHVEKIIQKKLDSYKASVNKNLTYEIQKEFPLFNKNIDILIPNVNSPIILIESSYNITTGSGQSKRADQLVELYSILMKHNANHRNNKILMLNYCDGFGWVGRQNDLHRIYDASDFVFNQKNLHILDNILDNYLPKL
ncbi:DpnII family type II restriction endonuclease [Flavobacterium sp. KACC 22758]|uniref:DpnII family type II restriction endonuclease n=1 Tax=Flavobacterium sp. KACC 22758 TaxID=3025667 RepID=UPI002365FA68|nr:DpnII family type II restriction endonuclease [Flavobacterium sp. KACC 22758]WDF59895.1 DpnII family type II restriction endonuclease [Flavobacterium sp. KACC 22758]